jgi:hypothetical protein
MSSYESNGVLETYCDTKGVEKMTVRELINDLMKIKDKEKEVYIPIKNSNQMTSIMEVYEDNEGDVILE